MMLHVHDSEPLKAPRASKPKMQSRFRMNQKISKMPKGLIELRLVGDLLLARCASDAGATFFPRFEHLFETFANFEKTERILCYQMLGALILTSYAKKCQDQAEKERIFELKNQLFYTIVRNPENRRKLKFTYLESRDFLVLEYCPDCLASNTAAQLPRYKWQSCEKCKIDRHFFDVLNISHKFAGGEMNLFLSHDRLSQVPFPKPKFKGQLSKYQETLQFGRYKYRTKHLDVFAWDPVASLCEKIKNR